MTMQACGCGIGLNGNGCCGSETKDCANTCGVYKFQVCVLFVCLFLFHSLSLCLSFVLFLSFSLSGPVFLIGSCTVPVLIVYVCCCLLHLVSLASRPSLSLSSAHPLTFLLHSLLRHLSICACCVSIFGPSSLPLSRPPPRLPSLSTAALI
jgi:hypothetical protein